MVKQQVFKDFSQVPGGKKLVGHVSRINTIMVITTIVIRFLVILFIWGLIEAILADHTVKKYNIKLKLHNYDI